MKLGLSTYTFGWAIGMPGSEPAQPMNETSLIKITQDSGLKLVQFGDNLPLVEFSADRLDNLASLARECEIEIEAGGRRLTVENLRAHLKICRKLNARLLRFVIDATDYHPEAAQVEAVIREILPELEGITLGIENHDRFPAASLRIMMEHIGHPQVGICLDTANSLGAAEGLNEVLMELAPHTVNLHIKDFSIKRLPYLMGFTVEGRPAGQGMVELPHVLAALEPHGRCQSAILEVWTPPEDDIEATVDKEARWAGESLEYLRQFAWN